MQKLFAIFRVDPDTPNHSLSRTNEGGNLRNARL